jgi:membrane-associated phospholipid phosphatase
MRENLLRGFILLIVTSFAVNHAQQSIILENPVKDNGCLAHYVGIKPETGEKRDDKLSIFNNIFPNMVNSFRGKNIIYHVSGIAATFILVRSEVDYQVHHYFHKQENYDRYGPWFFPTVITGGVIPLLASGSLYLAGNKNKNNELKYASCAVFQAGLITLLYTSTLKAITGRPHGPHDDEEEINAKRLSKEFNFGFFRRGIFWGWPSGHTAATMAVVSCLTNFYPGKKWLKISGYALVVYTGMGVAVNHRGGMHWFSDAVAAAFMAYTIGSTVGKYYRQRYNTHYSWNNDQKLKIIPYSDYDQVRIYFTFQF